MQFLGSVVGSVLDPAENGFLAPSEPAFIADDRDPVELKRLTICGQKVQADADLLFARVLENDAFHASVVCADMVSSFHWRRAWHVLLDLYMKHVHVENALFLPTRFVACAQLFARLEAEHRYALQNIRNHYELRLRFAELVVVLSHSPKRRAQATSFSFTKGAAATATSIAGTGKGAMNPFHPSIIQQYAKAPSTRLVDSLFRDFSLANAPVTAANSNTSSSYMDAFYLCLNEFMFALENTELRTQHFVLYWVQCMIELHQKRARKHELFKPQLRKGKSDDLKHVFAYLLSFVGDRAIARHGGQQQEKEEGGEEEEEEGAALASLHIGGANSRAAVAVGLQGTHVAWLIWSVCIRYLRTRLASAPEDADWIRVYAATRELFALFVFEFPMSPSHMLRFFAMQMDLLMQRQLCRFPRTITEVMRQTHSHALPSIHIFTQQPYIQVKKKERADDRR